MYVALGYISGNSSKRTTPTKADKKTRRALFPGINRTDYNDVVIIIVTCCYRLNSVRTDLWLQFGQPERGVLLVLGAKRAARAASGYLALGRVQWVVGIQHADNAARSAPRARRAALGRRVVERAVAPRFQLAEVVQREHGRKWHRVLGVVADHHGRRAELPGAGQPVAIDTGTAVHDHRAAAAAERPEQRRVQVVPGREVLVVGRLVALVQAVAFPARAAAAATTSSALALPAYRAGPRLASFPLHFGPAHL